MYVGFGTVHEQEATLSSNELQEMIALGEKAVNDFIAIKSTRPLTDSEQKLYNHLLAISKSVDVIDNTQPMSGYSGQYEGYGDFGRSWYTPAANILKRAGKVVGQPIRVVRYVAKGDIKNAGKTLANMSNPIVGVASIVSANPKVLDYARITSPTSVLAIEDRSLRKKAAIGYGVAAVVAGAVFAVAAVGATAAAGTAAGAVGTASKAAGLATMAAGMIKRDKDGNPVEEEWPQERSGVDMGTEQYETEIKHMTTPVKALLSVGGVSLVGSLAYYLWSRR